MYNDFFPLGTGRRAEIERWAKMYQNVANFKIRFYDENTVHVFATSLLEWDETLHNRLSSEFNLVLFKFRSTREYTCGGCHKRFEFIYGYCFDYRDAYKEYELEWDSFALDEPSSLKYKHGKVKL